MRLLEKYNDNASPITHIRMNKLKIENRKSKIIKIIGIGNILMADDGLGVYAVEELNTKINKKDIDVIDGGTGGYSLLNILEDSKKVIFIDAVDMGLPPGTIKRFLPEQLKAIISDNKRYSLHKTDITEVIRMASLFGVIPQFIIFGVQPKIIKKKIGISEEIKRKMPELIDLVFNEI